ncbi:ribosome assembly protein METTL17, mitochondrial [Anabrus simplex]|uniref:ribosome assembly protein METTL17, mitochondrial n=1 Tax=Anabrus simplex TaxID=316456 RepID=UPI0035A29B54
MNAMRHFRTYGTRPKLLVELERSVGESLESNKLKARHHPGVLKDRTVHFPKRIAQAIQTVIRDKPVKALRVEGASLARYLNARHLPLEEEELRAKQVDAQLSVERKYGVDGSRLSEKERELFRVRYQGQIQKLVKHRTYPWQPIQYNAHQSLVYLVGRAAADYAVVHFVLSEMRLKLPEFKPRTLLDFGSGVGTVTWVANSLWGDSLKEYFSIDTSASMNDLASLILKDGKESSELPLKGVFYRQFLPVSRTLKYDIVVSAFSLFELPSLKARLDTLLTLWNKTQGYLVVIENGTKSGFQAVNEAREFILDISNNAEPGSVEPPAHVFAPCPHDKLCPRMMQDDTPCNFQVTYNHSINESTTQDMRKERFSYLILKKGPRPENDPQWPRIVRETLCRSKHVVCRMCTSSGKLQEIVFTASKHGKLPYACARASNWGDLLPVKIQQEAEDSTAAEEDTESNS